MLGFCGALRMIWLSSEDKDLLSLLVNEISTKDLQRNWEKLMEFTPMPSGSPQEEEAIQFLKEKLEAYGLSTVILRYNAYLSTPIEAQLTVLAPKQMEVQCTPYRQVGTTTTEGIDGAVVYIPPDEIGKTACLNKIILVEQTDPDDWMGLRARRLLELEKMGVKGIIVIAQDTYAPTVMHQRADFSVSGNPTPDNYHLIPRIPAIVQVSNNDGQLLKTFCQEDGMHVRIKSIVETGWKILPLLVTEIKGTKEAEKFILVNGHVDTPPFSPGVTDNVSGDIAMLELARILSKYKDRLNRSIRFAFWTGHEIGRYAGSTWYNDAFWHDLRYNCVGSLNIDSPGAEGATTFRSIPLAEIKELAKNSIYEATGINVEEARWPNRAGDASFWGTGLVHGSIHSARPNEMYDPFVNYSGGGWWWHSPWATLDRGDPEILARDVKVYLHYIFKLCNSSVLPINFIDWAEGMLKILEELQYNANKVRAYFTLDPVINRAKEFKEQTERLEKFVKKTISVYETTTDQKKFNPIFDELNYCIMWISRYINPVAHSNAEITEQLSMEKFGALPFPRLQPILDLTKMPLTHTPEFKSLVTKLIRQRNLIEDGFFLAIKLIQETLRRIELTLR